MVGDAKSQARRNLVATAVDRIRDDVFARPPGALLGSLPEIARELGVGIVTVQQAARILEHEGLVEVRRGPNGGYYGRRPDAATLERVLSAFMRMHPDSFDEALDITSLLFIELCGAAAGCADAGARAELEALSTALADCAARDDLARIEPALQDALFRMVDRPIFELLTRVTLRFAAMNGGPSLYEGAERIRAWAQGRRRIIAAVLARDEALARFEAARSNRETILAYIRGRPPLAEASPRPE